ncbi:XtrA/YqaO family protein [Cytobacillus praedii]
MEQKEIYAIVVCDWKAWNTELPVHGYTEIITHQSKENGISVG